MISKRFLIASSYCSRNINKYKYEIIRSLSSKGGQTAEDIENMPIFEYKSNTKETQKYRNNLYSWGFTATGALGSEALIEVQRNLDGQILHPKRIMRKNPQRMKFVDPATTVYDVAAGSGFTVIAATVHKTPYLVFGCGLNTDSQLGLQECDPGKPLVCVGNVVPIILPIEAENVTKNDNNTKYKEKVVKVAAGRSHTVCLTNHGKGFSIDLFLLIF